MLLMTLLSLALLYVIYRAVYIVIFFVKAKRLPTKDTYPILGHIPHMLKPLNQLIETCCRLLKDTHSMYVVWVGPVPIVALTQPQHIEVVLGSTKYIEKSPFYKFIEPWLGKGLLTSKGSKWFAHRKMLTPAFHFTILEKFIEIFSQNSEILVKKLQKVVELEKVDIFHYISLCALDIICETAMGVKINAQEQDTEYVNTVLKMNDEIMYRRLRLWLYPDFLFNLSPSGRRFNKYVKLLHDFSEKVINQRKRMYEVEKNRNQDKYEDLGIKKKLTFLDLLLECSENGKELTDKEIREEVDTFMFEGHDTTSAGVSWTLQMLASHPKVQNEAYTELEGLFQGSNRSPTMKDLSEMKYLERVIKESLRLYPSVPMFARCFNEDIVIDGYTIPAGITVGFFIPYTHRIPEHFPDPETFNPDNFLPEKVAKRHPYAYLPFSAGPRNCIGQKFALLEIKTVVSSILRHFKLEATGDVPTPIPDQILRPENGILLKLTYRNNTVQ